MTQSSSLTSRLRWWILLGILVAGFGLMIYLRSTAVDNAFRNANTILTGIVMGLLLLMWFVFLSGLSWWVRLLGLAALVTLAVSVRLVLQLDGFYGDMIPQFRWRWAPARDYEVAEAPAAEPDAARIDLRTKTATDFPRFLGPLGCGVVPGVELGRDWTAQRPRQLWRQPIGAGWSAFSVVGQYAVTQEQRGELELVRCYELKTGRIVWTHEDAVRFSETMGGDGPRATVTIVDGLVYAMGATGILNCLAGATGKVIWSRDILADHNQKNLQWGKSCSPLVFDDVVVVSLGDAAEPSLAAYAADSGRPLWHAGQDKSSYATPVLATLAGREQIVVVNAASVAAHDPSSGDPLWQYAWPGDMPKCSQPVPIDHDRVFISTGYGLDCAMLQIENSGGTLSVKKLWANNYMKTKFSNVVTRNGHVYGLDDGVLACLDLTSGKRKWKAGRYGHGQVLLVGDLLVITTETGEVALVEAVPSRHRELGRFQAVTGKTWNNAALSGPYLLVRNDQEAACYELPLAESHAAESIPETTEQ